VIRARTVRMDDLLWEALNVLAERNGRTAAEEARLAVENWLSISGNIHVAEERKGVRSPHANRRQHERMRRTP